jgi:hypothetical protein
VDGSPFHVSHQAKHLDLRRGTLDTSRWHDCDFDLHGSNGAFGVAMLTALCAAAVGLLLSLLFGVRRQVSSGAIRQAGTSTADTVGAAQNDEHKSRGSKRLVDETSPRSGLVSLTKIGEPLGHLIDTVAAGLTVATSPSSSAKVVAGAILLGYGALGFLVGYLVTTIWYQRELEKALVAQS